MSRLGYWNPGNPGNSAEGNCSRIWCTTRAGNTTHGTCNTMATKIAPTPANKLSVCYVAILSVNKQMHRKILTYISRNNFKVFTSLHAISLEQQIDARLIFTVTSFFIVNYSVYIYDTFVRATSFNSSNNIHTINMENKTRIFIAFWITDNLMNCCLCTVR